MLRSHCPSFAGLALIGCTFAFAAGSENVPGSIAAETVESQARASNAAEVNLRSFTEAWKQVRDSFYDRKLHGLDWNMIGQKYRRLASKPDADLAQVINQMLSELGSSHTGYYTPDEIAYYDLADIFAYGLRRDLPKHFVKGEVAYSGIGMITRMIDGRHFVSGIFDGYPAARAKIQVGDEIIAANDTAFEPVGSFADKVGQKITLTIRRQAGGEARTLEVVPELLRPNEVFRTAMENGARIIQRGDRKLGYVHVWSYARPQYQQLLETLTTQGKLKDADALIWDLRDGWGGAQPDYLDIFNSRSPTMKLIGRDSEEDTVNGRWKKPVILLINGGTRSGKEVLAYGFKKYGYGEVVGTRSAGALLAGRAYMQSNGNLLLIAVADVSIDNERLEGRGVTPDYDVPFDIRYANGRDPQLAQAIELLLKKFN